MSHKIVVPGKRGADVVQSAQDDGSVLLAEVRVSGARDVTEFASIDLPDEHLIEVELENGLVLWRRLDTMNAEAPLSRSSSQAGAVVLPVSLSFGVPGRSVSGFAVRLYRFFGTKAVGEKAAEIAAKKIEDQLKGQNELMACATPKNLSSLSEAPPPDTDILLLLHGTGSSTEGSFGQLAEMGEGSGVNPAWEQLRRRFTDPDTGVTHIYAFEHKTLTESPIENAVDLLKALPANARLHILSHSRGGLVGEVLARAARTDGKAAFDETDIEILKLARTDGADRLDHEVQAMQDLNRLLREKKPKVSQFVRVACPARGTILASERLDLYLSIIANLVRIIPGPQRAFFEVLRGFVKAMVGARRDAGILPGLEAMMPAGPLIAMLNRSDLSVASPLLVVGGDIEPAGVLRAIAVLATDLFFSEEHDVVVDTAAMLGGAPRTADVSAHLFLDRGPEVSHFGYFRNGDTSQRIIAALTGEVIEGTHPLSPDSEVEDAVFDVESSSRSGDRPVAILIPGVMGSHLAASGERVWANPVSLVLGQLERIGADAQGNLAGHVRSDGALGIYYGRLTRHLSSSHDTYVFHYDWRLSVQAEADRLAETVRAGLSRTRDSKAPVRIVAHSMGGLVARAFIARHRKLWREMIKERPGSRLLMLGTPNAGSAAIAAGLLGKDNMIRKLAGVDLKNNLAEVLKLVVPMPGLLELLPADQNFHFFTPAAWRALKPTAPKGWRAPTKARLDEARGTYRLINRDFAAHPEDADHMFYIAGQADQTVTTLETDLSGDKPKLRMFATRNGDGRVTWRSGHLRGVRTWYAPNVVHGDLPRDRSLFPAISDILHLGDTSGLPKTPKSRGSGTERIFEMPPEPLIYPAPDELGLVAMGGKPRALTNATEAAATAVHIVVKHGDLRYEREAIAVGHYKEAPLLHAERALDIALDGRMSRHRRLGLYPGNLGSSEVFFINDNPVGPTAALIVGLGEHTALSEKALMETMAQAFVRFALRYRETKPDNSPISLATLMIGHSNVRVGIKKSVNAILEALHNANQRLDPEFRITQLTFLELYEDRAVAAIEALQEIAGRREAVGRILVEDRLATGLGGRRRFGSASNGEWEHRIRVTWDEATTSLVYEPQDSNALVGTTRVVVNKDRVERLLEGAKGSTAHDGRIGRLLYEWLVPSEMKSAFSDGRNLTLVLDHHSASYPWELIEDAWRQSKKPLAVETNMLRSLREDKRADRPVPAASQRVLLVGDPTSEFAPLDEAVAEVDRVSDLFHEYGWATPDIILRKRDDADTSQELSLWENQVVHFAGHGVQDHNGKTGLVIGHGDILQPSFIHNMRRIPELVFLNCCHVGEIERDTRSGVLSNPGLSPHKRLQFAANMAVEFMRCGTQAVIAAAWEIDDRAARIFSETFYDRLLSGDPFGEAVRAARHETWDASRSQNTWGAYQCYGDPQFRLRRRAVPIGEQFASRAPASPTQAAVALEGLRFEAQAARTASDARILWDRFDELSKVIDRYPEWKQGSELLEALGGTVAELGDFERAIGFFEAAAKSPTPNYSVGMLEDLSELRVRVAPPAKREAEIANMIAQLNAVASMPVVGGAARRKTRIGDAYMRLAAHLSGDYSKKKKFETALRNACEAYEEVMSDTGAQRGASIAHSYLRLAASKYLLGLEGHMEAEAQDAINTMLGIVTVLENEDRTDMIFEERRALAEARLFRMIVDYVELGEETPGLPIAQAREAVIEEYESAFMSGSSIRGRREAVDDLHTTAQLMLRRRPRLAKILHGLADDLNTMPVIED